VRGTFRDRFVELAPGQQAVRTGLLGSRCRPSQRFSTGELTDKGSVSARMVLERRESVVESLYAVLVEGTPNILDACDEQANALV
jgi:hypothetical protein